MRTRIVHLKKTIVRVASKAREGHIASAFSIMDILWVLYDKILKINPSNPTDSNRDRFFLSKGHASLGLYAILAENKFIDEVELENFGSYKSRLGGHPDRNKIPGVEASTGSLGHGFPMAVGTSLGLKIAGSKARVFALIGDGECNEGTIWESAMLASHHKLSNLCCVIDHNHSTDRALTVDNLAHKFKTFGWRVITIDGHDHKAILKALRLRDSNKPIAIVANTIKGYGCPSMENNPEWHHKAPTNEEIDLILQSITK